MADTDANNTATSSAAATEQTKGIPVASTIPGFACTDFKGIMFELPVKYETIKLIGKGTSGAVISARNRESGEQIAIKKLSHVEDLVSSDEAFECRSNMNWFAFDRSMQREC